MSFGDWRAFGPGAESDSRHRTHPHYHGRTSSSCQTRNPFHPRSSFTLKPLNVPVQGAVAVIALLDEGATVPFIARYRKEVTGNLDEVQIRAIEEKLEVLPRTGRPPRNRPRIHRGAGQADARVEGAHRSRAREDRARRSCTFPTSRSAAPRRSIAREKGLEPLARYLWDQQPGEHAAAETFAATFVDAGKRTSPPSRKRSKARATSSRSGSARTPISASGLRQMMFDEGVDRQPARSKRRGSTKASSRCTTTTASRRRRSRRTACSPSAAARPKNVLYFEIELEPAAARRLSQEQDSASSPATGLRTSSSRSKIPTSACSTRRSRPKSGWN